MISKMFYCQTDEGTVEIIINNEVKKQLTVGDSFGELALLYSAPRSASVKCITLCKFWAFDRFTFRNKIQEIVEQQYQENRKFIENTNFFNSLTEEQKNAICNVLISTSYKPDDFIVTQGDSASSFFIIKQGKVAVIKDFKKIRELKEQESFGEQALYHNATRTCSIKAINEVICLSLGREAAMNVLGDQVQNVIFKNIVKWSFENHRDLSNLTPLQLEQILDILQIKRYQSGEIILKNGEKSNQIIICLEGIIKFKNQLYSKGKIFGAHYLIQNQACYTLSNEIEMGEAGAVGVIILEKCLKIIGGSWQQALLNAQNSHEKSVIIKQQGSSIDSNSLVQQKKSMYSISDFYFIKKLGFGQFGLVYLVQEHATKKNYALKCISKSQILENGLERHLQQEKEVMCSIEHRFLLNFATSLKDKYMIYFVLDYIPGLELFDVIRLLGLLSKTSCQFYIGLMILAIEYLHSLQIIYRDIKPENIMVDGDGYTKLIDMGTAKRLSLESNRTFTIIGTPHYLAPEIIQGRGYSFPVDVWSIGICLYEFMSGAVPFAEDAEDPYEIYQEVMRSELMFPSFVTDQNAKRLVARLLAKVPEERLIGGYQKLKKDKWFRSFNWDKLFNREIKPPYIPAKEKVISEKEIGLIAAKKIPIVKELEKETKYMVESKVKPKKENWDAIY